MTWTNITELVMTGSVVGLILYDVFLAATGKITISEIVTKESKSRPIIAFGLGVLIGHWYWH